MGNHPHVDSRVMRKVTVVVLDVLATVLTIIWILIQLRINITYQGAELTHK